MNRDITGETDSFQQPSSSSYLVYFFILSAAFFVLLPYLFPFGGILLRSGKKVDVVGKVKSDPIKKGSSSRFSSLTSDAVMKKAYYSESKCESLEALVRDMQKVVQTERERTFNLENEIRILKISETFLKERIQNLEDRNSRKDSTAGYTEFLMRNTPMTESKRGDSDVVVHELLRMVYEEKGRTSALEVEVRNLQKSETALVGRIQKLEEKFASYRIPYGQTDVSDREVNKRDYTRN